MKRLLVSLLILLGSCSPDSLEDFQHEGEALSRSLVKEMTKIHSHEELVRSSPLLKKKFDQIVDLIIEAKKYQQKHPDESSPEQNEFAHSEQLYLELKRIYALEGGKEIVEKAQREALIRLDAFERKQKQLLGK